MALTTLQLLNVCVAVLALILAAIGLSRFLFATTRDAGAPIIIPQTIPLVGHLFEVLRYGFEYFEYLAAKHNLPIFTLKILTKDVHIVNSPDLIVAVQKNPKVFDFSIFVNTILPRLFDVDSKTMKLANRPMEHAEGT
ncbi:MAG: hypothetical protein Q9225_000609 [Loekoesia sp. 1 TL-2023]